MLWIGYDEKVLVSYSYPRFDCKVNVSLFDLHGPLVVSSILYESVASWQNQYLNQGAILLKAQAAASMSFGHISS